MLYYLPYATEKVHRVQNTDQFAFNYADNFCKNPYIVVILSERLSVARALIDIYLSVIWHAVTVFHRSMRIFIY